MPTHLNRGLLVAALALVGCGGQGATPAPRPAPANSPAPGLATSAEAPPLPGYDVPRILLRREAAQALGRVQRRVRSGGLSLLVFDGYRPVRATLAMVEWAERTGHVALLDSGYIARRSRHNMGVAVDLTLVDLETGAEVPMGTPFDTFSEAAHTANAEGRVRRYRELLVNVMEAEGFQNYDQEWWHFSYPVEGAVPFDRTVGAVRQGAR
jgi:D-alanyl-D-alanine dipeptidase